MPLFLLKPTAECIAGNPMNIDGRAIDWWVGVDPSQAELAVINLWEQSRKFDHGKVPLPDCISVGPLYLVVSAAMYDVIIRSRLSSHAGSIPAVIVSSDKKRELSSGYYLIYDSQRFDILDREDADFTCDSGKTEIADVHRWCAKQELVPEVDLFLEERCRWFASSTLGGTLRVFGFTGFRLLDIQMS